MGEQSGPDLGHATLACGDGAAPAQPPVECGLTERGEYFLSVLGFIGLTLRGPEGAPCFLSANSCRETPQTDSSAGERRDDVEEQLGAQLPYTFMVARVVQHLRLHSIELLRHGLDIDGVSRALRDELAQHATTLRDPALAGPRRCFLHDFRLAAEVRPEGAGFALAITPNFKYMGSRFRLCATWTVAPRR
jgi:type VI secretion system protein ImpC